ncbi:ubiquilin-1-like [Erythrolamprus reginae]|uniref:ubiquilin-1-like n=1 Tax=Erythrolamprus reginae TaxID=121349 RepID=UPI00396CFD06
MADMAAHATCGTRSALTGREGRAEVQPVASTMTSQTAGSTSEGWRGAPVGGWEPQVEEETHSLRVGRVRKPGRGALGWDERRPLTRTGHSRGRSLVPACLAFILFPEERGEKLGGMMVESQVIPGVDFRSTKEPQVVRIIVKTPWQKEEFLVHKDMLVREFKEHVARHLSSSPSQIVLVYTGRILKDHKSLAQHGIHLDNNAAVYVVVRSQQRGPTQQGPTLPADLGPDPKAPRNDSFASDGLRELTASLGLNTANFTDFQNQLMSNPDLMLQLLENPFIQSKLSSPDLMKKLATKSPQIRQVIQKAPEISHVFSSPEGMRLLLELARNPAAVREIIKSPPHAQPCPGSVPSGDGNTALQEVLTKVQGLVQKALPKRSAPTVWSGALGGHQPSFDQSEKSGRARQQQLPSPKPWPPRSSGQNVGTAGGNDHSRGESGNLRGETGHLASAAVKTLFHQIIKHLVQSMAGGPSRNPTGPGLSSDVVGKAAQRYVATSRSSREQILALLQQLQSTDVLLASWSPKEMRGLMDIQQRLQALVTDEPTATERHGRSERPLRRSYSITSLCDIVAPHGPEDKEDFSAPEIWQSLAVDDFFCSPPIGVHLRGCSAQQPPSKQQTYKL